MIKRSNLRALIGVLGGVLVCGILLAVNLAVGFGQTSFGQDVQRQISYVNGPSQLQWPRFVARQKPWAQVEARKWLVIPVHKATSLGWCNLPGWKILLVRVLKPSTIRM